MIVNINVFHSNRWNLDKLSAEPVNGDRDEAINSLKRNQLNHRQLPGFEHQESSAPWLLKPLGHLSNGCPYYGKPLSGIG